MAIGGRATLRMEPYDPDAIDGDNDGIVQEGTSWERPVGTRLLDELGRELIRGAMSGSRPAGVQVVGGNGQTVSFIPSYGARVGERPGVQTPEKPEKLSFLGRIGFRSLKERGLPTVGQISGKDGLGPRISETTSDIAKLSTPQPVSPPQPIRQIQEATPDTPKIPEAPKLSEVDEGRPLNPGSKASRVMERLKAVGVNWRRDSEHTREKKAKGMEIAQRHFEGLKDSAKEFADSEDKSMEAMGIGIALGTIVKFVDGKPVKGWFVPDFHLQSRDELTLTPKERFAVTRELIGRSGNQQALKEFDDFIDVLARGDRAEIEDASKKLMSKAGSRFDDRVQMWTSTESAEKIVDSGRVLTAHDIDEGARGFGLFSHNATHTREVRRNAEAGLYSLPKPKEGEADRLKGMRPTSGEAIPRPISEEHEAKMRSIYGDDVVSLYDYALGSSSDYSKAKRAYGRGSPARLILKKETNSRTRIHYGDAISDSNDVSVNFSDIDMPENANITLDKGWTSVNDLLIMALGDADSIRTLRKLKSTDHYNETATIGGVELDDVEAVIIRPELSHHLAVQELLGPMDREISPTDIHALIGAMRFKDETEDAKGVTVVVDFMSDEVELDNPTMTRQFIEKSPRRFEGVDLSFVTSTTTPYEALLRAELVRQRDGSGDKYVSGLKAEIDRVVKRGVPESRLARLTDTSRLERMGFTPEQIAYIQQFAAENPSEFFEFFKNYRSSLKQP